MFPHSRSIFGSLSHLLSPLLHCKIWYVSSMMCPYPLGHLDEVHAPLFPIAVPVRSCTEAIIVAHICIGLGALFVVRCSNSQSTKWWVFAYIVSIFLQKSKGVGEVSGYIESDRFVDIFLPCLCSFFWQRISVHRIIVS